MQAVEQDDIGFLLGPQVCSYFFLLFFAVEVVDNSKFTQWYQSKNKYFVS